MGAELTTYNGSGFGTPLDIQVGVSKRLKYLPFRLTIIAHQLHKANVRYDDPDKLVQTDIFGEPVKVNKFGESIDNIFRHIIINGEFMLGKNENLRLRAGYNHLRRKELSLRTFRSLAGFSLGFGIKVSAFKLDYGVGYYHVAGATNHISISTDLGRLFKKCKHFMNCRTTSNSPLFSRPIWPSGKPFSNSGCSSYGFSTFHTFHKPDGNFLFSFIYRHLSYIVSKDVLRIDFVHFLILASGVSVSDFNLSLYCVNHKIILVLTSGSILQRIVPDVLFQTCDGH